MSAQKYFHGDVVFVRRWNITRLVVIDGSYFDLYGGPCSRNIYDYKVIFLNAPHKGSSLSWVAESEIKRYVRRLSPLEVHNLKLYFYKE